MGALMVSAVTWASEYHGQVTFGGLPVPGAMVTATQGAKKSVAITDQQGLYSFPDLSDGSWTVQVEMTGFAPQKEETTVAPNGPTAKWELKLLSLEQMRTELKPAKAESAPTVSVAAAPANSGTKKSQGDQGQVAAPPPQVPDDVSQRAADGLLIHGSVNNAATSQFSTASAFGNSRSNSKSLYNGGFGVIIDNSALDARPFSLSGQETPKASYNRLTGVATLGGPIRIPHFMPRGPNFFVAYQWSRNVNATTQSVLVPDLAQRDGAQSGCTFPTVAPAPSMTPAQALLCLYPLPNLTGNPSYNYQTAITSNTHQDALQSRMDKSFGNKNQLYGGFAFQSTRTGGANLFGFVDKTALLGINTNINWSHRYALRLSQTVGYNFSRLRTRVTPNFANKQNVSSDAGITGTDQDPASWGPPTLVFSSGIVSLSDANSAFNRNRTDAFNYSLQWSHFRHNVTGGFDFRRQQFNYLSQSNPQGTLTFTGADGSDFTNFLLGLPEASAIAFGNASNGGNADKYLRQSVYDAYLTDDWRVNPQLTINYGVRWEYGAPITETKGRLVNLDVANGFTAVAPVLANTPVGSLTGQHYPSSLVRPDRLGFEPRIGLSWRPIPGSSMVVKAGYGIYDDTSVYQSNALNMAQQNPFSKSLSVSASSCPITLANPFSECASVTANTFAIDPNFRVGYAQTWQASVQRDLPGSLQMTATYLGIKGTRGVQAFLPNTYPAGGVNPCPSCPTGFTYRTSNGNSTREAGQIQLRRRLHSGLTASLQYTYSKSIDDDSLLGGQGPVATGAASQSTATASIAQNWLDLRAERSLSTFDQRHLLNAQVQYTTGMGLGGRTLMSGWRGTAFKEWTFLTSITAGSGLPQSPIYLATVGGTGVVGPLRPNLTGASIHAAPKGQFLNPAAFAVPAAGQWGNAGRDSITGPNQFSLNATMTRTFRIQTRYNLTVGVDATNLLNYVTYTSWTTTINNSSQFGLPSSTSPMRSLETTLRLRY